MEKQGNERGSMKNWQFCMIMGCLCNIEAEVETKPSRKTMGYVLSLVFYVFAGFCIRLRIWKL